MRDDYSEEPYWVQKAKKVQTKRYVNKNWKLILSAWALCLIPIPFTGIVAGVVNFAAFVMAIVALTKGAVKQGVGQLCSVLILTPLFYILGALIFASLINNSLTTGNLTQDSFKSAITDHIHQELAGIRSLSTLGSTQADLSFGPKKTVDSPSGPDPKEEKIKVNYTAYLKQGGVIDCVEIKLNNQILSMKTKSGMVIEVDRSKINRVEKFQSVGNKTTKSVWHPSKG